MQNERQMDLKGSHLNNINFKRNFDPQFPDFRFLWLVYRIHRYNGIGRMLTAGEHPTTLSLRDPCLCN